MQATKSKIVINRCSDIRKISSTEKEVRIAKHLTMKMAKLLLYHLPKLEQVVFTLTAKRRTSVSTIEYLKTRDIDVIFDFSKQGRPVKFSRIDLDKMISMRKKGLSYSKIGEIMGLSCSTVSNAVRGTTKFLRWNEDYCGKSKVVWRVTRDGDPRGRQLADNHYSRKTKGAKLFCGPGQKLVLITPDKKALFVWRKNKYRQDGQKGVECTIFRNEGAGLSSELIKEAVEMAKKKWPKERLFTYVNPDAVKSTIPGYCFRRAGWREVGTNKDGILILLEAPK